MRIVSRKLFDSLPVVEGRYPTPVEVGRRWKSRDSTGKWIMKEYVLQERGFQGPVITVKNVPIRTMEET